MRALFFLSQGVGLSEEDQEYYVPPSPVRGGPVNWSDLGHASQPFSRHSLAVVGGTHSRTGSVSSSIAAAWGGTGALSLAAEESVGSIGGAGGSSSPPVVSPKRSSFVVLRGAKGDAALTERRTPVHGRQEEFVSPPRMGQATRTITPPTKELKHRNSLKPFLEAEAGDGEEWERSLQDERNREEMELRRTEEEHVSLGLGVLDGTEGAETDCWGLVQYARNPYSPRLPSSSFQSQISSLHSRASTYHQSSGSNDPWSAGDDEEAASIRRHQSLNSFRQQEPSSDVLSTSSSTDGWGSAHGRFPSSEEILGSLSLSSTGFSRSRSGTGPAPLALAHSAHSHGSSTPHSSLSHSNSLSSHHSHSQHGHSNLSHSSSLSHDRGSLSPVGGFPRSPWSPTLEETKQLGMGVVVGTPPAVTGLSRGGSGSSKGSGAGRIGEEVGRLADEVAQMDVVSGELARGKPATPPGLDVRAAVSMGAGAVSGSAKNAKDDSPCQQQPVGVGRSLSSNASPTGRRLPPLLTNLDALSSQQPSNAASQMAAFFSRQGPASAAAYVPPIGHSHLPSQPRSEFMPSIAEPHLPNNNPRGNFTAVPGGSSADWSRQKEMLIGNTGPGGFSTAVGVNSSGDSAWPAGGGFGVGLAMQQQQQIQVLQSQMQQALSAMDMMRNQGTQVPVGFNGMRANGAGSPANGFGGAYGMQGMVGGGSGLLPPPSMSSSLGGHAETVDSPIDMPSLIATKGYNPTVFELRPPNVSSVPSL